MMSREQIMEMAKRLAIDEFTITKEYLQVVFLSVLYGLNESQKIYFKGGTATRLLLKSGRFSEDLDFTVELSADELDKVVADTVRKMQLIVPDISISRTEENKYSFTAILKYQPEGVRYPLTIHLDFSLREKPESVSDDVLESDYPVVSQPVVRHLDWVEMLAEKIRAFLYRAKGRDMYDLWFMLFRGVELDWALINRKTALYDIRVSIDDLIKRVDDFDDKQLINDLNKFLPAFDRGLVTRLKEMTRRQLLARKSFAIITSENLDYSKLPGHSFAGKDRFLDLDDLKTTKIVEMRRQDENSTAVKMVAESGVEATAYIRARTRNGVRELGVIERNASDLLGVSYDELLNRRFLG